MAITNSIFTDKILLGDDNFISTPINTLLWKSLNPNTQIPDLLQMQQNGYFFIVKKFNDTDSSQIGSLVTQLKLCFDQYGNIADSNKVIFNNPLTRSKWSSRNPGLITKMPINNNLILSPNMKWILYQDKTLWYLMYNPIHRRNFKQYYNSISYNADGLSNSSGTDDVKHLITKYCEIVAGTSTPGMRNFADPTCKCLMKEECIDDSFGSHVTNQMIRNKVDLSCVCLTDNCKNPPIDGDSFLPDFTRNVSSKLPNGNCPTSITISVCDSNISAGGNVNSSGLNIKQDCGVINNDGGASVPSATQPSAQPTTLPSAAPTSPAAPVAQPSTPPAAPATQPPESHIPSIAIGVGTALAIIIIIMLIKRR